MVILVPQVGAYLLQEQAEPKPSTLKWLWMDATYAKTAGM